MDVHKSRWVRHMEEQRKIEERLRKKEQEIIGLEERLRTARVYVQALQDVLRLLNDDNDYERSKSTVSTETVLREGSAVAQARQFILKRGEPVHISALLEALGKGSSRDNRASLTSSLAAYVRRGEIFTRPAPNTFGLMELGHITTDETHKEPPPPPGFGSIRHTQPPQKTDDDIPF